MNTVTAEKEMAIRKISGTDFRQVRLLPVQLTQLPVCALKLKQLRLMAQVQDYELLVCDRPAGISAFMALKFTPDRSSVIRYLLIKYFAVDRMTLTQVSAIEIELAAVQFAYQTGCTALMVRANALSTVAARFYQEHGYSLHGEALIKKL